MTGQLAKYKIGLQFYLESLPIMSTKSLCVSLRVVKRPSKGFWEILKNRTAKVFFESLPPTTDAVGLVQGSVAPILCAADIAEKASAVQVTEVKGLCPSHLTLIALFGDTSSVEAALNAIRDTLSTTEFH